MTNETQAPTETENSGTEKQSVFCEGGCGCGAVRYQVTSAPLFVHACHCRYCQRQTGSSNVLNALIEADRVTLQSGEIENLVLDTPSGRGQRIARCAVCNVAVWSSYLAANQEDRLRFLRVGTSDNPGLMPPDIHIYTSTKLPWYILDPATPAVENYYDKNVMWPRSSQQRLKALSQKAGAVPR